MKRRKLQLLRQHRMAAEQKQGGVGDYNEMSLCDEGYSENDPYHVGIPPWVKDPPGTHWQQTG